MSFNPHHLEEFTRRLQASLPPGAGTLGEEFRAVLTEALSALLARMELVTREEFDVQAALLEAAQQRLDELERTVAMLEQGTEPAPGGPAEPPAG